jgi:hypothetical protein
LRILEEENRGTVVDSGRIKYRHCCEFWKEKIEALFWILGGTNRGTVVDSGRMN